MILGRIGARGRIFITVAGFSVLFALLAPSQTAFASYCSGSYKGRDSCQGYFSGANASASSGTVYDIIQGGTSASGVNDFVDEIDTKLTGSGSQNSVGAAFIIANMLGKDGTDFASQAAGQTWARNHFDEWETLIRQYNTAGYIDWSKSINTATSAAMGGGSGEYRNSAWFSDIDDSAFHNKNDETITVIEIRTPSGGYFRMERKCLNLVGTLSELVPLPATIDPQSLVNDTGSNIIVDAASGSTVFKHRILVSNYRGLDHTVKYRIERSINTDETCNAAYENVAIGSVDVTANGYVSVWGPSAVDWDRDTTARVCQRLRITDRDGATLSGSNPAERYANVRSGLIEVRSSSDPVGVVEPGAAFSMDGWVTAQASAGNSYPMTYSLSYTNNVAGLSPPATEATTVTVGGLITYRNEYSATVPLNAVPGTEICVTAVVTAPTLDRYFGGIDSSSKTCLKVVIKPVFMVNGGDVIAGSSVDVVSCDAGPDAIIRSWNVNTATYTGASTQLSAYATGLITGFATATRGTTGVTPPSGLAFSNQGFPVGESYGGNFGRVPCISNHWVAPPSTATTIFPTEVGNATKGSGVFTTPGNFTVNTLTVAKGVHQIVYVGGDLTINGNILYDRTGGWAAQDQIPALKFVVTGKILIGNTVGQLDGIYTAVGDIDTCGGFAIDGNMYGNCGTKLVVNGVFISQGKINLKRTFGNVNTAAPGNVAEEFNYRPEIWLANWPDFAGDGDSDKDVNSITSMPPVL